jgi:hypothetical protein
MLYTRTIRTWYAVRYDRRYVYTSFVSCCVMLFVTACFENAMERWEHIRYTARTIITRYIDITTPRIRKYELL